MPVTEDEPRTAYGEYGTGKAAIEALLHRETLAGGVPSVVLHPGHISGPGWPVITPAGNLDPGVWTALATGQPLALPDHGLGVLHHVHADDVAQAFERALSRPAAIGASFHVVAAAAMTLRGLATGSRDGSAGSRSWTSPTGAEFERRAGAEHAATTREHTFRSITASIARARETLGYAPRYTALEALHEALAWLAAHGQADVAARTSDARQVFRRLRAEFRRAVLPNSPYGCGIWPGAGVAGGSLGVGHGEGCLGAARPGEPVRLGSRRRPGEPARPWGRRGLRERCRGLGADVVTGGDEMARNVTGPLARFTLRGRKLRYGR